MIDGEPTGETESDAELFPEGRKLSELAAEVGEGALIDSFTTEVVTRGEITPEALAIFDQYVEGIRERAGADWQAVVDPDLKHALQIRQQVLAQVGEMAILWAAAVEANNQGKQEIANELFDQAIERAEWFTGPENILTDKFLTIHREYFEGIVTNVLKFLNPEP